MSENYHFELGKTYVAIFENGDEVVFQVIGGGDPYKIRLIGGTMIYTRLLNQCKVILPKEDA